jgi:hypothetical protein
VGREKLLSHNSHYQIKDDGKYVRFVGAFLTQVSKPEWQGYDGVFPAVIKHAHQQCLSSSSFTLAIIEKLIKEKFIN